MKENTKQLSSEEKQYRKMTEEPVCRLIMKLGLPTTISMLITNVYNMVDTWFVCRLGTSATGAVGIVFGLMAIIQAPCFKGNAKIISDFERTKKPYNAPRR